MDTHTFRAPDMMAALEKIQHELGPDAMVVSVREVFDESIWKIWKRPGVEVLAAEGKPGQVRIPRSRQLEEKRKPPEPDFQANAIGIQEYAAQQNFSGVGTLVPAPSKPTGSEERPFGEIREALAAQGVVDSLTREMLKVCQQVLPPQIHGDRNRVVNYLQELFQAEIEVMPEIKFGKTGVVSVVGSGGSGKTSTIAKLAARYAPENSHDVAWVTADTIRAGAIAEAAAYTDSLEIPLHKAYTPEEFGGLIEELRVDHFVLADLFDVNPRLEDQVERLKEYLQAVKTRETYLILPATAKTNDMQQTLDAYQKLNLTGLIPTKVDETSTIGNIVSAAWSSRLPLAFYSDGSRVVDPLQRPDAARFSRQLFSVLDDERL